MTSLAQLARVTSSFLLRCAHVGDLRCFRREKIRGCSVIFISLQIPSATREPREPRERGRGACCEGAVSDVHYLYTTRYVCTNDQTTAEASLAKQRLHLRAPAHLLIMKKMMMMMVRMKMMKKMMMIRRRMMRRSMMLMMRRR